MTGVRNDDIPTASVLSYFVIKDAMENDCALSVSTNSILPKFGVEPFGVFPPVQLQLLWFLYSLLVFPTEVWRRDQLLEIIVEHARRDQDLMANNKEVVTKEALRSIRNAVSHARIEFKEDAIIFQDQKPNQPPHFEKSMTYEEITNFLLVLGRAFHESVSMKTAIQNAGRKT